MAIDKFLLVPVDFTPESIHALHYAHLVATQLNVGITVAHIHQSLFDPVTGSAFDDEVMKNNRDRLQEMLLEVGWDQFRSGNHIPVNTHFDEGDVASHVIHLVEDPSYKLVVMSSHPESSFVKRVFGSVSTSVGRESAKPVIVVPHRSPLKFPEKIVVGLSEDLLQDDPLTFLLEFAAGDQAFIEFVHVTNDVDAYQILKGNLVDKLTGFHKPAESYNITSVPVITGATDEDLVDYAIRKKADILVLATHHRNFIDSLGHRSVTKKILSQPVLPVMILHGHHDTGLGITDYLYNVIKEG